MEKDNTFAFDGFKVADEYFMSEDCYFVATTGKTDKDGDKFNIEVEYDLKTEEFSFAKCYEDQVLPCDDMPLVEKQKIQIYILKKVKESLSPKKRTNFAVIMKKYFAEDSCMEKLLSTIYADGLNLEEAFFLYVLVMKKANGDRFIAVKKDEVVDLTKKADEWECNSKF